MPTVHLLDYVAGNVRSLVNAINKVGYEVEWIRSPEEVAKAQVSRQKHPLHVSY
jgi:glutamine amidotransferase/cyclase